MSVSRAVAFVLKKKQKRKKNSFSFATEEYAGRCLLKLKCLCAVYDYAEKADLSKGYWNPKRKVGVTTHFFRDN